MNNTLLMRHTHTRSQKVRKKRKKNRRIQSVSLSSSDKMKVMCGRFANEQFANALPFIDFNRIDFQFVLKRPNSTFRSI